MSNRGSVESPELHDERGDTSVSRAHKAAEERIRLAKVLAKQAALLDRHGSIRTIANNLVGTPHLPQSAVTELEMLEQEAAKLRDTLMGSKDVTLDEQAAAACRIAVETSRLAAKLALEQTDPDLRRSTGASTYTTGMTEEEPSVTYISETNVHSTLNLGPPVDSSSSSSSMKHQVTDQSFTRPLQETVNVSQPSPIPLASPRYSGPSPALSADYLSRFNPSGVNSSAQQVYELATPPRPVSTDQVAPVSTTATSTTYTTATQKISKWGTSSAFEERSRPTSRTLDSTYDYQHTTHQRSRSVPAGAHPAQTPSSTFPVYHSYQTQSSQNIGLERRRSDLPKGAFGFLSYRDEATTLRTPQMMAGPIFDDSLVLSVQHYHHGDHHHNHWQRHIHHFHDLHLLGTAEEVLDMRSDHVQVESKVIPGESMPQMKFRPDVIGRQAFEEGMDSFLADVRQKYGFPTPVSTKPAHPGDRRLGQRPAPTTLYNHETPPLN